MASTEERTRLSRDAVVAGALDLIGDEGLDGLTIRGLAQRLGVTPMALYWHFKNKDQLLRGIADHLWSRVDNTVDPTLSWSGQLRSLVESLVRALREHPAAVPLVAEAPLEEVPSCMDTMEVALEILHDVGFTEQEAADICFHGLRTATGLTIGQPGWATEPESPESIEESRRKRLMLMSLPSDRYPHVIAAADRLSRCEDTDAYYAFGIDLYIAGVEALHARKTT